MQCSGDYQFNFGIDDSSDDDSIKQKPKVKKDGRGRPSNQKECPGCGSRVPTAIKECPSCDYMFTRGNYTSSADQHKSHAGESKEIRSRFPFEPEREEDGSLMIQQILGRRLRTVGKRWGTRGQMSLAALKDMSAMDTKHDFEYLIKYKGASYLHTNWLSATEIGKSCKEDVISCQWILLTPLSPSFMFAVMLSCYHAIMLSCCRRPRRCHGKQEQIFFGSLPQ